MYEKIIEIIVYLVNEIRNNKRLGEIDLKVLEQSGYTQTEISNAFSWLFDKLAGSEENAQSFSGSSGRSYRILHDVERMVISPDAHGYLIQLRELGILTDAALEGVIERAMMSNYPSVGLEEVKSIVCSFVFEKEESNKSGNRYLSQWSDTIQ